MPQTILTKVVYIVSGRILEAVIEGNRAWDILAKDGTPNHAYAPVGYLPVDGIVPAFSPIARYDEKRERIAGALREKRDRLAGEVEAVRKELFALYATSEEGL